MRPRARAVSGESRSTDTQRFSTDTQRSLSSADKPAPPRAAAQALLDAVAAASPLPRLRPGALRGVRAALRRHAGRCAAGVPAGHRASERARAVRHRTARVRGVLHVRARHSVHYWVTVPRQLHAQRLNVPWETITPRGSQRAPPSCAVLALMLITHVWWWPWCACVRACGGHAQPAIFGGVFQAVRCPRAAVRGTHVDVCCFRPAYCVPRSLTRMTSL
jgi:hypothetical protein